MSPTTARDGFLQKWRQRWPEWDVAEGFVPPEQRELVVAWFALLQEWMDAATAGDEPAPGLAKLAWWQEELHGWSKGARRHPLGEGLQARPVGWAALAQAMTVLRERDALHTGAGWPLLQPLATQLSDAEAVLFGGTGVDARLLAADWLAGSGMDCGAGDDGGADGLPRPCLAAGSRPRRLLHAVIEGRRRGASRWSLPWRLWSAARTADQAPSRR
ncbi:MAG: phytoene/squalene synthase family protein [Pseudoxanthomonas suwonensis]|nr:phytoene/squalene synthase family protein [Pseudoxanthomonas suwonensis]